MPATEISIIVIAAAIIAGIIGYLVGRRQSPASAEIKKLSDQHLQELAQKQAELEAYQQQVHDHYNKTANLFKDMAGSYKELFDHLSIGFEQLENLSDQRILPERAGALLDGPDIHPKSDFMNPNDQDEDALRRHPR